MNGDLHSVTVFVADDHSIFRRGLEELLATAADISVVGQAGSGADALRAIFASRPEVAVVDIAIPEMNGLALIERLRAVDCPPARSC